MEHPPVKEVSLLDDNLDPEVKKIYKRLESISRTISKFPGTTDHLDWDVWSAATTLCDKNLRHLRNRIDSEEGREALSTCGYLDYKLDDIDDITKEFSRIRRSHAVMREVQVMLRTFLENSLGYYVLCKEEDKYLEDWKVYSLRVYSKNPGRLIVRLDRLNGFRRL